MKPSRILKNIAFSLVWWAVLYAWFVLAIDGAYNLMVARAVLQLVVVLCVPFLRGQAENVMLPILRRFDIVSGVLTFLLLVWFGHGWLAACQALSLAATSFHQHLCRKAQLGCFESIAQGKARNDAA